MHRLPTDEMDAARYDQWVKDHPMRTLPTYLRTPLAPGRRGRPVYAVHSTGQLTRLWFPLGEGTAYLVERGWVLPGSLTSHSGRGSE